MPIGVVDPFYHDEDPLSLYIEKAAFSFIDKREELIEEALMHHQVQLEDVPARARMHMGFGGREELYIDDKLVITFYPYVSSLNGTSGTVQMPYKLHYKRSGDRE